MKCKFTFIFLVFVVSLYGQDNYERDRGVRESNKISEIHSYGFTLDLKDSVLFRKEYYHENGRLQHSEGLDISGKITSRAEYFYDEEGNNTKMIFYNKDGSISNTTYWFYCPNRACKRKMYYEDDGSVSYGQSWYFNKYGMDTTLLNLDDDGNYYVSYIKYVNEQGHYYKSVYFNEKGKITETKEAELDERGNILAWYEVKKKKRTLTISFKYDANNNQIERSYTTVGAFYIPGSYNSDFKDPKAVTNIIMSYKWDSAGNKVEQSRSENGKIVDVVRYYFVTRG
jgi:hypothetical protein